MTTQATRNYPYQASDGWGYVNFWIAKSTNSYTYKREVQKVSEVLSFIGGIIGAVSAILFIINIYTDFSFEVAIASELFKPADD